MQWDKVKNVLIVILAAVNLFLLGNLGARLWQNMQREAELDSSLRTLAQGYGLTLDEDFKLPDDKELPELSVDRSRQDEEAVAAAALGDEMERAEREDGTVIFESSRGSIEWYADGRVQGSFTTEEGMPENEEAALRVARRLFADWRLQTDDARTTADGMTVTLSGTVAGLPVFNRTISVRFDAENHVTLSGLWSFGIPYTTVSGSGVSCNAADALLEFISRRSAAETVLSMEVGYRMQLDSSRRLQLTPTWKIVTDSGEYLVDCDKKTIIDQEN